MSRNEWIFYLISVVICFPIILKLHCLRFEKNVRSFMKEDWLVVLVFSLFPRFNIIATIGSIWVVRKELKERKRLR